MEFRHTHHRRKFKEYCPVICVHCQPCHCAKGFVLFESHNCKIAKDGNGYHEGYTDVTVIRRTVEEIRKNVNQHHKEWYQKIKEIAESPDVNEESRRTCGRQTQRENHPAESVEDYYRRTVAIPVLDHLFNEL